MNKKKYRIKYQTIKVVVEDPRRHICQACKKSFKVTAMHHYKYAYKPETVKENPELALENTLELCFYDHQIADAFRTLVEANPERVRLTLDAHPDWFIEKILKIFRPHFR